MIPAKFDYAAPTSVEEALGLLCGALRAAWIVKRVDCER